MTESIPTTPDSARRIGLLLKEGDRGALAELYTAFGPTVFHVTSRILRSRADAEDAVQWTFIKAWEARSSLREPQHVRAWLTRIAVNRAYTVIGKRRPATSTDDQPAQVEDLVAKIDAAEKRALLHRAIEDLSPRQHDVVCLRVREELSFKEIGSRLGCSDVSARVNYRYGVKRLMERFAA